MEPYRPGGQVHVVNTPAVESSMLPLRVTLHQQLCLLTHGFVCRRVLYISAPISHTTASSEIAPAVTAMGAIYWTQVNGLRTYKDKVAGLPDGLQTVQEYVDALAVHPPSQPSQATLDTSDDDPDYDPR